MENKMELSATQNYLAILFILGIGTFVLLACSAYLGYALAHVRQGKSQEEQNRVSTSLWYLLALIGFWFATGLASSTGNYISPRLVIISALVPIAGGTLLSFHPHIMRLLKAIPTHWLIYLQSYRVAGGIFIFPYMTEGILSRGFAISAGIGDILTGVLAIPVAWLVLGYGRRFAWAFYAWTALGILDLVVAFISSAIFGFNVEGVQPLFPITTIPLFFGPPLGVLMHIITLRSFWLRHREDEKPAIPISNAVLSSS